MEIKNHDEYWQAANRLEELQQAPYCKHAAAREVLWQEYWELEKAMRQYLSDNPEKTNEEYWRERCKAAEKCLVILNSNPMDYTKEDIEAPEKWRKLVEMEPKTPL